MGLENPGPEVCGLSSVTSVKLYLHTSSPRYKWVLTARGFPGGSGGKESAYNAGELGLIPRSGRFPGKENGYLLQYSCPENSIDRRALWATIHGVANSQT